GWICFSTVHQQLAGSPFPEGPFSTAIQTTKGRSVTTPTTHPPTAHRPRRSDTGATFVEVLVAIVLLGTVVVGTLAGVRATLLSSAVDRDHANAHAWLQSASDLLYGHPRHD